MVGVKFPFVGFSKDLEQSSRWEGVQGALNLGGGRGQRRWEALGAAWGSGCRD